MVCGTIDPQEPSDEDHAIVDQFVQRIGEVLETAFHEAAGIADPAQRQELIGHAFMEAMTNYNSERRFITCQDISLRPTIGKSPIATR